jgi:hypothetical protein
MFSNLGIERHMFNENIGYDLNQHIAHGLEFKKYGEKYQSDNQYTLLGNSSAPEWGSIVEALTDPTSTKGTTTSVEGMSKYGKGDNTQFNAMVSNYATTHRTYASSMVGRKRPSNKDRIAMERSLNAQKNTIIARARQISNARNTTSARNVQAALSKNRYKLNQRLNAMREQNIANKKSNKYDERTIGGAIEYTGLNMNSMYYHLLVYFVIAVTLIAFTFNLMVNPNASVLNAIYVLGALFTVYFITKYSA